MTLYRGITTHTQHVGGLTYKTLADPVTANRSKNALVQALYTRTVSAIVKRANSCKRPNSTVSSDSNDSGNCELPNNAEMNRITNKSTDTLLHSPQMNTANGAGNNFIGILDMFGFEDAQSNGLEQMCINLCAETLQHFYNTHVFIGTQQACADEGIQPNMEVIFFNNVGSIMSRIW